MLSRTYILFESFFVALVVLGMHRLLKDEPRISAPALPETSPVETTLSPSETALEITLPPANDFSNLPAPFPNETDALPEETADEVKAPTETAGKTADETADEAKASEKTKTPNDIPAVNAPQTTFQNPTFNALLRHKREGWPFRLKLTRDDIIRFWGETSEEEEDILNMECTFLEETPSTVRFHCPGGWAYSHGEYDVTFFATGPSFETGACTAVAVRVQTRPAECLGGTCEYFPVFFDADTTDCGQTQQPVFNHLFLNQPTTPAGFENPLFGRLLKSGTCLPDEPCSQLRVTPQSLFNIQTKLAERCLLVTQDASKALLLCEEVWPAGFAARRYHLFTPSPEYEAWVRHYKLDNLAQVEEALQNPDAHHPIIFSAVADEREEFSNFLLRPEE